MLKLKRFLAPCFAIGALSLLAACSKSGAPTQALPILSAPTVPDYVGPASANADIQAFKINLWENIKVGTRCGACHNATGQSPRFARNDDVNLAYQDAVALVNLTQPELSRLVAKVSGGHNCWLQAASACGDTMTVWIRNWAGAVAGGGKQISLTDPVQKTVGSSKTFPASSASYASTIYPIVKQYCSRCHSPGAMTPQSPYFAGPDVDAAYAAARAKINLDTPSNSRLVVRLRDEFHNCWSDCASNAATMLAAVNNFAGGIPLTQVDPSLLTSKALSLYDGTVAAGGNRVETNIIAMWEFKTGKGSVAYDTSGVEPAINLNLTGDVTWVGGWGLKFGATGHAQGATSASKKLSDLIKTTGEYSVEAWMAPADVVQEDAFALAYSGGGTTRNFTLSQRQYQYEAFARSDKSNANGAPSLLTNDKRRDAQASLQHVVLTYDPVIGRKLYVNGKFTQDMDSLGGGALANWDDSFAFVLGSDTGGTRQWKGVMRFAALHNRALSAAQVLQNYNAGVGERYFMLFSVASLLNVPRTYIMFEVSQLDSYGYQFTKPTFIALDPAFTPTSIPFKAIRIGINGAESKVGQAYIPLDATVTASNYNVTNGQLLSSIGTVVALEKGPDSDEFFLTFEQAGPATHVVAEPAPPAPPPPVDLAAAPDIGVKVFDQINAGMSAITGVPLTETNVRATFARLKQQLPTVANIAGFLSSHQVGVSQLAIEYCNSLVEDTTLRTAFWPGVNFATPANVQFATPASRAQIIDPIIAHAVNSNVTSQPDNADIKAELDSLTNRLAACGAGCAADRTKTIAKASCAAVIGSATTLLQ